MTTHKLVPCEPTEEMIQAVQREIMYQLNAGLSCQGDIFAKELCEAMLESAPEVISDAVATLAFRNSELQNRIEILEDLLSSAYCIANRNGEDTHWQRFASRLHVHGISPVTAKTFHILPSDEGYVPEVSGEAVAAWEYERATEVSEGLPLGDRYEGFERKLSFNKPKDHPQFRNASPLFRAPQPDRTVQLEADKAQLIALLRKITGYAVTQVVACNGLKCREPLCESCSFDAEEAAQKAAKDVGDALKLIADMEAKG